MNPGRRKLHLYYRRMISKRFKIAKALGDAGLGATNMKDAIDSKVSSARAIEIAKAK